MFTARAMTSPRVIGGTCCRFARSSPMKQCCVTGAMQIDVFALLTEARQRIAANIAGIEAQRDFWLASSALDAALIGGGAAAGENAARAPNPAIAGSGD